MGSDTIFWCDRCGKEREQDAERFNSIEFKAESDHVREPSRDKRVRGYGLFCESCNEEMLDALAVLFDLPYKEKRKETTT